MPFSRSSSRSAAIISAFIRCPPQLRVPVGERARRRDLGVGTRRSPSAIRDHERVVVGRDQRALEDLRTGGAPRPHLHLPTHRTRELTGGPQRPFDPGRADLEPVGAGVEPSEVQPREIFPDRLREPVDVERRLGRRRSRGARGGRPPCGRPPPRTRVRRLSTTGRTSASASISDPPLHQRTWAASPRSDTRLVSYRTEYSRGGSFERRSGGSFEQVERGLVASANRRARPFPDARTLRSTSPRSRPRLPTTTCTGYPIRSASANFTPARSPRSSSTTSTPRSPSSP